jgi:hypothetical protein
MNTSTPIFTSMAATQESTTISTVGSMGNIRIRTRLDTVRGAQALLIRRFRF